MKFDIEGDASGFSAAMKEVQESVMSTYERIEKKNKDLDESLANAQKDLSTAIEKTNDELAELQQQYEETSNKLDDVSKAMDEAFDSGNMEEFERLKAEVDEGNASLAAMDKTIESAKDKLEEYNAKNQELAETVDKVAEARKRDSNALADMLGGQEKYNTIISALPPALQNSQGGIMNMVKAAKAFIATPLGAAIALIAAGIKALMSYFTGTVEGERKFAQISGYLSGVMAKLNDVVISVGKALMKCFTEPKDALKEFGDFLIDNIVNRFKAIGGAAASLGDMLKDLFNGDWSKLSDDAKSFGDQFLTMATGIEDVTGKLGKFASEANEVGKQMGDLAVREKDLEMQRSKWAIERARLEAKRNQLQERMSEGTIAEQQEAIKAAIDINNQIAAQDKKLAKEAWNIVKLRNSLASSNSKDVMAENAAHAEYERVDAEAAAANRRLARQLVNAGKQLREAELQLTEQQSDSTKKLSREAQDAEFAAAQARIDAMREGAERQREQRELDHQKSLAQIERQEEDEVKAAREAAKAAWKADSSHSNETWNDSLLSMTGEDYDKLSENDKAVIDNYFKAVQIAADKAASATSSEKSSYESAIKARANAEAEAMRQYLKDYGSYEQQRMAVRLEYQKKINAATTEGEKLALQEGLKKALSDIDLKALQNDLNWGMLFGDLNKYTNSQLKSLRSQLKDYRKSESYKNATVENKKAVDEAMTNLDNTIQSKSGIFGGLAEAFNNLSDAEIRLKEAEEEIKNAANDREREAATRKRNKAQGDVDEGRANLRKSAEQTRDNVVALANTITSLGSASEMTLSDLGNFVNQFASMFGETGQKIGGWIGAIFSICDMIAKNGIEGFMQNAGKLVGQALGGLFGVDIDKSTHEYQAQKQMHDNYIKLINETLDKQKELLQKQSGMDALGTYSDAKKNYQEIAKYRQQDIANFLNAGGSKGFLGIGSSSSNGVKLRDKLLTDLFPNVFGNLKSNGYAGKLGQIFGMSNDQLMSDKRMTWLADATAEQIEALKKEQDIWAKLPEEVQNYYQEILDAKDATDELAQAFNETIVGTSFDSMVSSFTSALDDMEADAEEFGENFDDIVRKAAVKSLVDTKYRSQLEKFYGDAEKGTGLAGALAKGIENVSQAEIDKLRKDYQGIGDAYQNDLSFIYDKLGLGSNSSVSATNGVAASFSQDSIDEANGRMAALQIGQQSQIESLAIVAAAFPGLVTVIGDSNAYLSDIRNLAAMRTSVLNDVYERMGIMQREISGHLAAIVDNTNNL